MFGMMETFLLRSVGERKFFHMIEQTYPKDSMQYVRIHDAYVFARVLFEDEVRESGHRYFEHLEVTAILAHCEQNRLGLSDPDITIAALLHDVIEMKPKWTREKLERRFNARVAYLVHNVSKEPLSAFPSKELRDQAYEKQMWRLDLRSAIVKLSDQTHNLSTLWAKPLADQQKKIALAWRLYYPLSMRHQVLQANLYGALITAQIRCSVAPFLGEYQKILFK